MGGTHPDSAMVLAAGLGLRLRPLTLERPKPLIEVGGRTMINRILDRLVQARVASAVVNLHYLADDVRTHLAGREHPNVVYSDETHELLETGGGVAHALGLLGASPFFVINSDVLWLDGTANTLLRLARRWNDDEMDALLLMHPTTTAHGYGGPGDYHMEANGKLRRRREREVAPFVFAGLQILHPRLFADQPPGAYSLNRVHDAATAVGRLFGLRHDGAWVHVGSPAAIATAEALLKAP